MALENQGEDIGTRYYGTSIDDPMNYGYGSSGFGFSSNTYPTQTVTSSGFGQNYDFWSDIGVDPKTTMENWKSPSNIEIESAIQGDPAWLTFSKKFGSKALDLLKTDGKYDFAKMAALGFGAYSLANRGDSGGYSKPVPKMEVFAARPQYDDANRRPGAAGRNYFTQPIFTAKGDTAARDAAVRASLAEKSGLEAAAPQYAAAAPNPYAGKIPMKYNPAPMAAPATPAVGLSAIPNPEQLTAEGGLKMAEGGLADAGRYLRGKTDGMADEIPSSIDGEQPAALSHGEFVIPADVVSHLGNGNSDAGAQKLYEMMARIRKARTGTTKQGKEIDADEFTMGGLAAAYAGGGAVKGFDAGGQVVAPTPTAPTAGGGIPQDTSRTSTLSPWVGDYVTNALAQGAAMAATPYQAYKGPLTAGASNLQQQAFAGASDIAMGGYTPGTFTGSFGAEQATQYMNPYLQASLDPQLKELKRQADIARLDDAARLTRAGAFGGSRQAIMESEGRRNLLDKQAKILGEGYKGAFDTGAARYAADQAAQERSRQFSADFGLQSIKNLADLGAVERGITSEGLAADKRQFEEERDFYYGMPKYQLGLLSGLPIGAQTAAVNPDPISRAIGTTGGLASLYQTLANFNLANPTTPAAPAKK